MQVCAFALRIVVCTRNSVQTGVYGIFNTVWVFVNQSGSECITRTQLCVFHNDDFELQFHELKTVQCLSQYRCAHTHAQTSMYWYCRTLHMIEISKYDTRFTCTPRCVRECVCIAMNTVSRLLLAECHTYSYISMYVVDCRMLPIAFVCGNSAIALNNSKRIVRFARRVCPIHVKECHNLFINSK